MICRLCLTGTEFCISLKNAKTQAEDEEFEDRAGIIGKHFDLSLDVNADLVCTVCWQQIKDFHLFYLFIEEKQKELTHQSQLLALTCTKMEAELTEYEHELFTKDATADEMHLRNESIIDTKNTPMVPENTFRQWNKVENPQEWNENLEFVKNDELIEEVDLTNAMSPRIIYEQDAEMRDEDEDDDDEDDDGVDIKDESTIDISSLMITENNFSQLDKDTYLHEETENRPAAQNEDLIDTVNVEQSSNSTNANGNTNDVNVTTVVLRTETHRKEASNESIQQIPVHRNQRENFALKCDLCAQTLENFDKLKQHFKDQHNCEGYVRCCNKQYYCSQYYADHLEWHLNPNLWKCGTCDNVYDCRVLYEVHLSKTHELAENFKFQCTICPAKFSQEYLLHHHEKDYHSDQELKSDKCKTGFRNLKSHKCHQIKHQKMKCDQCNKEFKSVGTLAIHKRRVHLGTYRTACDICGRILQSSYKCKLHKANAHPEAANPKFQCPHCPQKFAMIVLLNVHKKIVHGEQNLKCDQCNKEFKSIGTLAIHKRRVHLGTYRTACDICGKILQSSYKCKLHKASAHREAATLNFQCPLCPKKFAIMALLNAHKKTVHGEQRLKCDQCNKEFKSIGNLTFHKRRVHLGTYRTACNICGEIFPTPYNCKLHKSRVHPKAATFNFQCPHCPQKFAMMALLNVHKKTVHGEQKLQCDQCNKEFKSVYSLKFHKRKVHLGTYRTACDVCGKIFETATKCKIHKARVHPEAVTLNFQCSHCPQKFAMIALLNMHKKKVHGEQKLKCDECNKEFKSVGNLTLHRRKIHLGIYRTACDICGKIFPTPYRCKLHKARAHREAATLNFQCSHCPKNFAMIALLNMHKKTVHGEKKVKCDDSEQKHKCDECNKEFKSVHSLSFHKRRDHLGIYRTTCDICGKIFRSRYNYRIHKAHAHPEAVTLSLKCSHCPKKFAMRALLNLHEKNDHCKKNLESNANPPLRAQKGRTHLRTHKIVCYICCETFSSKSNYELHKEAVHKETEDTDAGKYCSNC